MGFWLSANEWDRQSEVDDVVAKTNTYDIPATVMVLEQWSDEHTFYVFNDAQYTAKPGGEAFSYHDFTFGAKWPDPKAMVDNIHDNGMKVLFWQIPILKYTDYAYEQKDNDESYMIAQGYGALNGDGSPYRIPEGWFGNSLLLDFTNPDAVDWWMSKRSYLMDDIGIDGFKTDGGEMVWGRETSFFNGKKGDEMRNQYPNEYIGAYYQFAKSKNPDAFTFSRSGTTGAQQYPAFWAGDQESNFYSFRQAVKAGLSAGISGIPYWSWDLAGFTGNYPSSELYKRSTSMSAFSPIMQVHSEKADPPVNEERTPWNAQARTGDTTILDTFSHYVNVRMNLLPYIYSEAKKTSESGVPMMRSMALEYPEDPNTHGLEFQYMFGDNLLVSPIVEEGQTIKQIYLPQGEWIDFFHGASRPGGRTISYYAGVDDIPVFVKAGSILPMNLNGNYELGGSIGRDLEQYNQLSFRVYPQGGSSYEWFDDIGGGIKTVSAVERYDLEQVTVELPPVRDHVTLQVYTTKPDSVEVEGVPLPELSSLSALSGSSQGWVYEPLQKFVYVKVPANSSDRSILLDGVHKASYEAEFAELSGVTTNNDHPGYTGPGFVDGFASSGKHVEFDVYAESAGTYVMDVNYSSAGGTASRAVYVNSAKTGDIALPSTPDWNTWASASMTVNLHAGHNSIRVAYDSASSLGINLDNITLRR